METSKLIQANNEKRTQLTKQNRQYYENMLVYIRLNVSTSEQETEETLSELLDHLLEGQEQGKVGADIFGDDPRKYADEIIAELPRATLRERTQLVSMAVAYFLGALALTCSAIVLFSYYILNIGDISFTFNSGSFAVQAVLSITIALALLYLMLCYLRWSCFKNINKTIEFIGFWLYGIISIGLFVLIIVLTPHFGPNYDISIYTIMILGVVLVACAFALHKIKK